nr:MAG TPA: restriction alleviation protein [Caudoviricetes sp.]
MVELKPCPLCGGKARLFVSGGAWNRRDDNGNR